MGDGAVSVRAWILHGLLAAVTVCVILSPPLSAASGDRPYPAAEGTAATCVDCLSCHDDHLYRTAYPASVHAPQGCTGCHGNIDNMERHMNGETKPSLTACGACHGAVAEEYIHNYHYLYQDFQCYDCHRDIHAVTPRETSLKKAVLDTCTECHANEEYAHSGHGIAVAEGNEDAATCSDCHGLHSTRVYHTSQEEYPAEAREFYTLTCIRCHDDREMMARNCLSLSTVAAYRRTYHGKVQDIGHPTRVAGCADCHTSHNILPKEDPASTINPDNLVNNCGKCHTGFHPRFVRYQAHPDFSNRERYPALYWTNVFMVGLLTVTFIFFWIHTFLWWRKTYWDKHYMEKMGIKPKLPMSDTESLQSIERFSRKDILIHILLVISFLTLVATGFPLKYHDAPWARIFIDIWGGVSLAGIFHRTAAVVLFVLFFYILARTLRYLFPKQERTRGWLTRLFSAESLFFNKKDLQDMKGMFKWFFDRGEQPKFDRWTYWEKFDFLAVFWGMAIIGGSGIFLMVPEWTSYLFPGWVLNVAALLHSEEALLAALFIFTVHFFNTHLIPKKFPMDRTIFTGRLSLHELYEEKREHYEKLVAEGKLEELKRGHPGIFTKLAAAAFGLASLILGLFLAVIIMWSLLFL
ncbi:MAG: cytochrome C [Deltaproteobacteria bacterium]|nr:cytochrome C [Deltaproteobacteria bacterium]